MFFNAQNDGAAGAVFCRVNASSSPYNYFLFHNGNVGIGCDTPGKMLVVDNPQLTTLYTSPNVAPNDNNTFSYRCWMVHTGVAGGAIIRNDGTGGISLQTSGSTALCVCQSTNNVYIVNNVGI